MDDWVWVESAGTALDEEPSVSSAQFGDGYQQLAPTGLNPIAQVWSGTYTDVDDSVAIDMITFLREHGGVTPFSYVPLWSTTAIAVIAPKWNRTLGSKPGMSTITVTFNQWFGA